MLVTDGSSAESSAAAELVGPSTHLHTGVILVSVDGLEGDTGVAEQAQIDSAIADLNSQLGSFDITLQIIAPGSELFADINIHMAATSVIGGVAEGVLGVTESGGEITIISGWNWYLGTDAAAVPTDEYDFKTVITHELGHAVGLGHSPDATSVMYWSLTPGEAKNSLTADDLLSIGSHHEEGAAEPLMASPFAGGHKPGCGCGSCTGATQTLAVAPAIVGGSMGALNGAKLLDNMNFSLAGAAFGPTQWGAKSVRAAAIG
jgi:hypothetical protein